MKTLTLSLICACAAYAQIQTVPNTTSAQVRTVINSNFSYVNTQLGLKAALSHVHLISGITGLQAELDGKSSTSHNHNSTYAALSHVHLISDITDLQTGLDGKAATGHNHDATYSQLAHVHLIAGITGLQTALDGKAATSHSHAIADVTGLQAELDASLTPTAPYSCPFSSVSSIACTHSLGTSLPWVSCYDGAGLMLGSVGSAAAITRVTATTSNIATITFSGIISGNCSISTGSMGPIGTTGATGDTGPAGPSGSTPAGTGSAVQYRVNGSTFGGTTESVMTKAMPLISNNGSAPTFATPFDMEATGRQWFAVRATGHDSSFGQYTFYGSYMWDTLGGGTGSWVNPGGTGTKIYRRLTTGIVANPAAMPHFHFGGFFMTSGKNLYYTATAKLVQTAVTRSLIGWGPLLHTVTTDTPVTYGAAFYYSSTKGTNWYCYAGDGTAANFTDTGTAADTNEHRFTITETLSPTTLHFYIDGVEKCGSGITANITTYNQSYTTVTVGPTTTTAVAIDFKNAYGAMDVP